ncbi:HWE histidine kinase domain-containing protein [Henriciella sp.]|uniref:sensor histidine kinase n=1 Tax=Henriciella sp. TaxID=1968823 RepID=UPI00260368BD|nr:HWE histidine kinase domain-containing protein [Henriciella sp.]
MPHRSKSDLPISPSSGNIEFRRFVDEMVTPYVVLDSKLRIVYANASYLNIMQRKPEAILDRYVFDVFPDTPGRMAFARERMLSVLQQGKSVTEPHLPYTLRGADGEEALRIWEATYAPYFDDDGSVTHIIFNCRDITETVALRREKKILADELNHRVKNMLAMIQSVSMMSADSSENLDDFLESFEERLIAIDRTFVGLQRTDWKGMTLRQVLEESLAPFGPPSASSRIRLKGPNILLSGNDCHITSLVLHEFATNAAKYGCFKHPGGRLNVNWSIDGDGVLEVVWEETGMSGIKPPKRTGFGTKLASIMPDLNVERDFFDHGMRAHTWVRLSKPAREVA